MTNAKYPGYPYLPGITAKPGKHPNWMPQLWFAKQFRTKEDVKRISYNDTIRHGDFVVRVISWMRDITTADDVVIVGIQSSYPSIVTSKYSDKLIWGRNGISHTMLDYQSGIYLPRS